MITPKTNKHHTRGHLQCSAGRAAIAASERRAAVSLTRSVLVSALGPRTGWHSRHPATRANWRRRVRKRRLVCDVGKIAPTSALRRRCGRFCPRAEHNRPHLLAQTGVRDFLLARLGGDSRRRSGVSGATHGAARASGRSGAMPARRGDLRRRSRVWEQAAALLRETRASRSARGAKPARSSPPTYGRTAECQSFESSRPSFGAKADG